MNKFELFYKVNKNDYDNKENRIYFKRPQIIEILESNGFVDKTANSLKYFQKPRISSYPLDLNEGFESYKFRVEDFFKNTNWQFIEKHLIKNTPKGADSEAGEKIQICTNRSVLYRLMMTPYRMFSNAYNDITIYATKFNDIMFLSGDADADRGQTKNDTYHFKLEQFCFSDSPGSQPCTDAPIDENIQTFCIYRSELGNFDIVYSAGIMGIESDKEIRDLTNLEALNQCRFVLTKLLKPNSYPWQKHNKILNWWVQAYLVNVNDIYMGMKDDEGKVRVPIKHVVVKDLPKNQIWQPHVCIRFLHEFLSAIQKKMINVNSPYTVYEFQYDSSEKCINYRIHEGKTEKSFLTETFIKHMQKK